MKKEELNSPYVYPEVAKRKMKAAQTLFQTVYIFGVFGYGKTALVQHYLSRRKYYYIDAATAPLDDFQFAPGMHSIVVVDNLQFAEPQEIRDAIIDLTDRRDFWLILLARCPVPYWLVTAFVRNSPFMMVEERDLALSEAEVAKLMEGYNIIVDDESLKRLHMESFGQPLSLRVAAMKILENGMDSKTGTYRYTPEMSEKVHQMFWAYLEQEVYDRWDSELLDFVMQVCILDHFTIKMAEELTGMQNVAMLVRKAGATGNFLIEKNGVYTFVPMMLVSMRQKLKTTYTKQRMDKLYYNAGRLYRKEKQMMKALEMFQICGDEEQIGEILIENVRLNPGTGYLFELRCYYLALPESNIAESMELTAGMSMLQSLLLNTEQSEHWYQHLKQMEETAQGVRKREIKGWLTFLDISLPHRGSDGLLELFKHVGTLLVNRQIALPELCVTSNAPSLMNGGKDFCEWSKKDKTLADGMGKLVSMVLGRFGAGLVELALAESFFEKGHDPYEVIRLASKGQIKAESQGNLQMEFAAIGMIVRTHIINGHADDAKEILQKFIDKAEQAHAEKLLPNLYNLCTRVSLLQGEKAEIAAWMEQKSPNEMDDFWPFERYRYMTKIRIYILYGKYELAESLIEKMLYYAEVMHRTYIKMECKMLLALSQYRRGWAGWRDTFQQAYSQIESYHFVRLFSREGSAILPLLKQKPVTILDEKFYEQTVRETTEMATHYPAYLKVQAIVEEIFSDNAIRILRYQAEGMSNEQIAKELHMTVSNVKYHCKQTYKKLDVTGKAAAVIEARKRKLI